MIRFDLQSLFTPTRPTGIFNLSGAVSCSDNDSMAVRHIFFFLAASFCLGTGFSWAQEDPAFKKPQSESAAEWHSLFDGKTLDGWRESPFTARGKVSIENGTIFLGYGYMTGITWTGDFPTANYEIRYKAARIDGSDFFGAVTFPVHDTFCTFVNGGWGGSVTGLSSLDLMDASENETMLLMTFQPRQWYSFRVRVMDLTIEIWIDEEPAIYINFNGREVGLRPGEIENSKPLGFAAYRTLGALKDIEYRRLPPGSNDPN